MPIEGERADEFLDDAGIEASSAKKIMPTEGKRADDFLDDAGSEASSAENWSDTSVTELQWYGRRQRTDQSVVPLATPDVEGPYLQTCKRMARWG